MTSQTAGAGLKSAQMVGVVHKPGLGPGAALAFPPGLGAEVEVMVEPEVGVGELVGLAVRMEQQTHLPPTGVS